MVKFSSGRIFSVCTGISCYRLSLHGLIPKENLPVFFALLTAGGLAQIIAGVMS